MGLYGGKITGIAVSKTVPNILFAASQYGYGLFKSNDSGNNWQPVETFSDVPLHSVAIDKTYPGYVYAGGADGFWKSTDSGIIWAKVKVDNAVGSDFVRTITVSQSGIIYIGCGNEGFGGFIYSSTNRGNSWTQIFRSTAQCEVINKIEIDPVNSDIIWAVTGSRTVKSGGRIYRTTDGGTNWSELSEGEITSGFFDSIAIQNISVAFVSGETGIYKISEGGTSIVPLISTESIVTAIEIDSSNTDIIYAAAAGKIYKSTDTGITWQQIDIQGITALSCITIHPSAGSIIFAGDYGNGVLKSSDFGINWSKTNTGLSGMSVYKVLQKKEKIYLATVGGLYSLQNGTFVPIDTANGRCTILTESGDLIYTGYENGKIYKYSQTGSSYINKIDEIVWDINISSQVFYIASGKYDGTDGHLYKSSDGGVSFVDVLGSLGTPANSIATSSTTIFVGTGDFFSGKTLGGLWRYKTNWEKIISGEIVKKVLIRDKEVITCFGGINSGSSKGLYKSGDDGDTFKKFNNFPVTTDSFSTVLLDGNNIYTTDIQNFYISSDNGNSWTYTEAEGLTYGFEILNDGNLHTATSKGFFKFSGFPYSGQKTVVVYNYPNPFNLTETSQTTIKYSIMHNADVKVGIYTITGKLVKEWNAGYKFSMQSYFLNWDGKDNNGEFVSNGLYILVVEADKKIARNKIAVVR